MKISGIVLFIIGLAGLLVFGLEAMNDSESFNFLGLDVAVSSANWAPVIISGLVLVVGLIMWVAKKK